MTDERENYCKLLGINPFRKNPYTEEELSKIINSHEEKWRGELVAGTRLKKQGFVLNKNLTMVSDMRATMDSPVLRDAEFEAARKYLERRASKIKRLAITRVDGDVYVPVPTANEFAEKLLWENVDGRVLIAAAGLSSQVPAKRFPAPYSVVHGALRDVETDSLAELVNAILEFPEINLGISRLTEESSYDELRTVYESLTKKLSDMKQGRIPNLDLYLSAVRSVRSNLDSDEKCKDLIHYLRCMKAMRPAMDQMDEDQGDPFSRAYIDNLLVNYTRDMDVDTEMCLFILEEYCIKRLYPSNFSPEDSNLENCPNCRTLIDMGPNCQFCPVCGGSISTACPSCGSVQRTGDVHCTKCGIDLINAAKFTGDAETSIRKQIAVGNTDEATEGLKQLESQYPQFTSIPVLKAKLRENADKITILASEIADYFSKGYYYTVKKLVEDGKINYTGLLDRSDISMRYEESLKKFQEADELCVSARPRSGNAAVDLFIKASEICPDHPDAIRMLREYPPEGPGDGIAEANGDFIDIRYAVPEDRRGMTFCIYRNEGSYPEVNQSTKPLAEIEGWAYSDKTVQPGIEYYYKIYSKRWGVLSEEYTTCDPALILCEVTNVHTETTDDGIRLTYEIPRGATGVRIWRKESDSPKGEAEDEIFHNNNGEAYDTAVKSGTSYTYLFASEYEVNGRPERSCGTMFTVITEALPNPVDDLSVRWDRIKGNHIATWSPQKDEVALYYTVSREISYGMTLSVRDLNGMMNRIDPLDSEDGLFRFTLPELTVIYVVPAVIHGNTAVLGKECIIANLRPFYNLTKVVEDGVCRLSMSWPSEVENAVAEITRRNPDGSLRTDTVRVGRDEYFANKSLEFPLSGTDRTEVSLFAEYIVNGEEKRSIGINTQIYSGTYTKVNYTIDKESVKGDRKKTRIIVSFDCPGQTVIPRCVMIACTEGIPLKQKDGEMIWESSDPITLTDGLAECSFVLPKDEADLSRMRLFFPDTTNYNKYRFVHPLYNRRK